MANEYNGELISKLYKASNEQEVLLILEDIEEIGDPVFLKPLIDGYEKYKETSIGHYFLSVLGKIKSPETGRKLQILLERDQYNIPDLVPWFLYAMTEQGYSSQEVDKIAQIYLVSAKNEEWRERISLTEGSLRFILEYLNKGGLLKDALDDLRDLFFRSSLKREAKKEVFYYLTRIPPKNEFSYLVKNYEELIKNKEEIEIIVAKELIGWRGTAVDSLKDLILKIGHVRAKEILNEERLKKEKETSEAKEMIQAQERKIYLNTTIIEEISRLREEINFKFISKFGFKLLPDNESLIQQTKAADDKDSLIAKSISLREITESINKEGVRNHGFSDEEVRKKLPFAQEQDIQRPINQLFLFLSAKGIKVDEEFFGIRPLRGCFNKLAAHPKTNEEFISVLTKVGLVREYEEKRWSEIHRKFLEIYKIWLENLNNEIAKVV